MGERLTWEEMVKRYPNKWVVLKEVERDWPDVISGIVVDAVSDDEIGDYEANCNPDLVIMPTTEGDYYGPINGSFTIETV